MKNFVRKLCPYIEKGLTQMEIMHIYGYKTRKETKSLYSLIDGIYWGVWREVSKEFNINIKQEKCSTTIL